MTQRNKITISFLPYDEDIWRYIQDKKKKCNISEYIRNLIRFEMKKSENHLLSEERIIEKVLQAFQYSERKVTNLEPFKETVINDETKNTINNLF
jgi:hypothetical protein